MALPLGACCVLESLRGGRFQWGSSHASMDHGSCLLAFPGDADFAKGQHPEA